MIKYIIKYLLNFIKINNLQISILLINNLQINVSLINFLLINQSSLINILQINNI